MLHFAFCTNSAKLTKPKPFASKNNGNLEYKFDALFQYVVKDRALRDYYAKRQVDLAGTSKVGRIGCGGCSSHSCTSTEECGGSCGGCASSTRSFGRKRFKA